MSKKYKYYILSRLSEWRKERRLTQEELARASGVGRTTIAALETGKRRAYYSTARKLAKVLKVKPEDLFAPSGAGHVVNVSSGEPYDVYIGRANPRKGLKQSIWHNPFKEGRDGTREEVIERFERHLLEERPDLIERLPELKGKTLGCWCAPEPCHGEVLLKLTRERA